MYRENIFQFMDKGEKTLFIPKNGGLYRYIFPLLTDIGITASDEIEALKQGAIEEVRQGDLEIRLARGEDIPRRVHDYLRIGTRAYGLTGDDLFDEFMLRENMSPLTGDVAVLNTYDWDDEAARYRRPALCLMNKTGRFEDIPPDARVVVNGKYFATSQQYVDQRLSAQGAPAVTSYNGDTESLVQDGVVDCCVEIVYSGATGEGTGLKIVEVVRFSDIILIGANPNYRK